MRDRSVNQRTQSSRIIADGLVSELGSAMTAVGDYERRYKDSTDVFRTSSHHLNDPYSSEPALRILFDSSRVESLPRYVIAAFASL